VQKSIAKWIDFLYGPFFRFLKLLAVVVLVGWVLTWFFASDESRTRLVDDVKQSIGLSD
jgi:hypothetical protein